MPVMIVSPSKVQTMPAKSKIELQVQNGNLRVCAYARVSTDDEEQMTSYHSQIEHYAGKIKENNGWDFVKVFADEGITGTSTKKRTEFNKMIDQCKRGKIDLIITKSISRFARNSLDSIQYARMLKRLGIGIIFEKENIDTRELASEMIFVVLSAFAQAESESMSANIAIGKRNGYKQGRYTFPSRMYGYEVVDKITVVDGEKIVEKVPTVVEDEAVAVRMMYSEYLRGATLRDIRGKLVALHIPASAKNGKWSVEQIDRILANEKYKGYIILQKTYVDDLFTKTIKVNNGELPKYIIPNAHTPIVTEQIFDAVQAERNRRNKSRADIAELGKTGQSGYSGQYALTKKVYCGQCGTQYQRVTWRRKRGGVESVIIVWKCKKRHQKVSYCKDSHIIKESELHELLLGATRQSLQSLGSLDSLVAENIQSVLAQSEEIPRISRQITEMRERIRILTGVVVGMSPEEKGSVFDEIKQAMAEIKELELKKERLSLEKEEKLIDATTMSRILELCGTLTELPDAYDDSLTREVVKSVIVQRDGTMDIRFIDGTEMKGLGCE